MVSIRYRSSTVADERQGGPERSNNWPACRSRTRRYVSRRLGSPTERHILWSAAKCFARVNLSAEHMRTKLVETLSQVAATLPARQTVRCSTQISECTTPQRISRDLGPSGRQRAMDGDWSSADNALADRSRRPYNARSHTGVQFLAQRAATLPPRRVWLAGPPTPTTALQLRYSSPATPTETFVQPLRWLKRRDHKIPCPLQRGQGL